MKRSRIRGKTHRVIASRYPTVGVFDDLSSDPETLRAAFLLESATNDRLALLSRRLTLLPDDEIVQGEGASLVMAAFLHADPVGARFTDHRMGAWYASRDVETAITETVFHSTRRLALSDGGFPAAIQVRELIASVDCRLVDIRRLASEEPALYDPADHTAARAFGVALRWPTGGAGENGIVYDSVRHPGGTNLCLYRPSLVMRPVIQGDHYDYRWDAAGRVSVARLTLIATPDH